MKIQGNTLPLLPVLNRYTNYLEIIIAIEFITELMNKVMINLSICLWITFVLFWVQIVCGYVLCSSIQWIYTRKVRSYCDIFLFLNNFYLFYLFCLMHKLRSVLGFTVCWWSSFLHSSLQSIEAQNGQHGCADHAGHHHLICVLAACGCGCHGIAADSQPHDLWHSPHADSVRLPRPLAGTHCQGEDRWLLFFISQCLPALTCGKVV